MDRGLTAATSLSPRPTGTMAPSYAKDVARVVQPGAVARRITQLQAALSPQDSASSNIKLSPQMTTQPKMAARSEQEHLQSSLSPSNIPLPQTPFPARHTTESNRQYDDFNEAPVIQKETGVIHKIPQNAMNSDKLHQQEEDQKLDALQGSAVTPARSASRDSPIHSLRSKPSILSPLFFTQMASKDLQPHDSPTYFGSTPDPIKRTSTPSPASAYSKISPFTSNTSFPSYIPTRQSPKNSVGVGPSLRKFKSMFLNDREKISPISTSPQSPRARDARSLRRKVVGVKPDSHIHPEMISRGTRRSASSSSTTNLEDVFTDPVQTANIYHVEPTAVADDGRSMSWGSSHDKRHSNRVVNNMPGLVESLHKCTEHHDSLHEERSSEHNAAISIVDGAHCMVKDRYHPQQSHGSTNTSLSSKYAASTRVYQSTSPTSSMNDLSANVLPTIQPVVSQLNQQNGLRVIITVDRNVENAVRIEVHPLAGVGISPVEHDEEDVVVG